MPHTPGWTPPPKPGLIPLRPLEFGTVLGASFQVLRRNPRPTFGAALLLNALVVFLSTGISTVIIISGVDRASRASLADSDIIFAGTFALALVATVLALGISIVAQALLQGIISIEVSRATLGEKLTLRQLLALGRGRWWALIGWTVILGAAIGTAIGVLIALSLGFFIVGDPAAIAGGVVFLILGGLGLTVLTVWLSTKLAFVPAAIIIERLPLGSAIRRSWSLVRGAFWRIFGTLLLVTIMVNIAASVVTTPFQFAASFAVPLVNPAGELETDFTLFIALNLVVVAITAVVGAIGAVLTTGATSLLYIDRRMRTEGLDLELQRYIEVRASGAAGADPYLTAP
jgi:MFS family permease